MESSTNNKGFTLIEIILAVALLMVVTVGSLSANSLATGSVIINQQRSKANFLAREAMEAVMIISAGSFTSLVAGDYHPVFTATGWILNSGPETTDGFTRTVTLTNVMRQLTCVEKVCDIVEGGGVVDEGSMMARITVEWKESGRDKEFILDTLLTYWR